MLESQHIRLKLDISKTDVRDDGAEHKGPSWMEHEASIRGFEVADETNR